MARKRKQKASLPSPAEAVPSDQDRWGDLATDEPTAARGPFTAGELGQIDQETRPGTGNPQGALSGGGPLHQEGEGERQNNQLAELRAIAPDVPTPGGAEGELEIVDPGRLEREG